MEHLFKNAVFYVLGSTEGDSVWKNVIIDSVDHVLKDGKFEM